MNEEELRKKIYEILGLEFGSLANEGGNDWIRAKNEALEEYKQKEFDKIKNNKSIDYLSISKKSDEFKTILNSVSIESYHLKCLLAQRNDLLSEEVDKLISFKDKDIIINISKNQKLTEEQINIIMKNSVYLTKKNLVEKQYLTFEQKKTLKELMSNSNLDYKELIDKLNKS
ncbi:hypothetical protein [Aliarcobacter butzleri]|uniref:hypothetical protein n=1 Tax=Aliarcobacter butzleri TaxID=28197 RepID=UPI003AF451D5